MLEIHFYKFQFKKKTETLLVTSGLKIRLKQSSKIIICACNSTDFFGIIFSSFLLNSTILNMTSDIYVDNLITGKDTVKEAFNLLNCWPTGTLRELSFRFRGGRFCLAQKVL